MKKEICYVADGEMMNFVVYYPETMKKNLPLIVYLHGAGERGTVVEHLNRHAIPKLLEEGLSLDAVVLCPQCPANCVWDSIPFDIKKLIDRIAAKYEVDSSRISITGSSMGGFGTWTMGITFSNFFSCIAPVAGGGMSWRCENLVSTPVYAYHGAEDETVPPVYSHMMVDAVNRTGGHATLTMMPGYGHNDGINAVYKDTDIIDKLLAAKRTDFTPVPETLSKYF